MPSRINPEIGDAMMSSNKRPETIPEHNILYLPVLSLSHNAPFYKWDLQGRFSPETTPKNYRKPIDPSVKTRGEIFMPRMSKKRKLEWQFFLNRQNRMTYNFLCRKCAYGCKQSFRAGIVECTRYLSKRAKRKGHNTL